MKKYFCTSDIHSYYNEMIDALNKAGFDKDNENHTLIVCGDLFDRGTQTLEVYNFIKSIPAGRRILIKGNHESLLLELMCKSIPDSFDYSNGTVSSCCQIAGIDEEYMNIKYTRKFTDNAFDRIYGVWSNIKDKVKQHEIYRWLQSDEWVNYYELDKYIFVHSFIPTHENWRVIKDLKDLNWEDARWGCPWRNFKDGLFNNEIKKGKILVCGHWHASDFHTQFEGKNYDDFTIYYGKNLIALDACTAYSKFCNVMILEKESTNKLSDNCYDTNKNLLVIK